MAFEGGAVYTAEKNGMFYVITDESTMAEFLDENDLIDLSLTSALEFDSATERNVYLMEKFGPGEIMLQLHRGDLLRFESIGFHKIGEWELEKNELKFYISHHHEFCNILYAFICQGTVVYVGKTDMNLEKHLWNFAYNDSKQGNLIKGALSTGKPVEIQALRDNGLIYFGGFQLNMANGLFDSIISDLNPEWN